jgi:hypothetical protein
MIQPYLLNCPDDAILALKDETTVEARGIVPRFAIRAEKIP